MSRSSRISRPAYNGLTLPFRRAPKGVAAMDVIFKSLPEAWDFQSDSHSFSESTRSVLKFTRLREVLLRFGLSENCILFHNFFSNMRLENWVSKNSKWVSLGGECSLTLRYYAREPLTLTVGPLMGLAKLADGVFLLDYNEAYVDEYSNHRYIVFDRYNHPWGIDEIKKFTLNFSKKIFICNNQEHKNDGNPKAFDSLFLPDPIFQDIKGDIDAFLQSRRMYKEELDLAWKRGYMLIGPPGNGKCLGKDTPVLMFDGTIKMVQDVKVGDSLMGDDSSPRKVLSISSGREDLYKIVPKKGDPYVVNFSHILSLKESGGKGFKKGTVHDISLENYLKLPNHRKHHLKGFKVGVSFKEKEVPLDPYLIGYWLGDGSSLRPDITTGDPEIISYFEKGIRNYNLFIERMKNSPYDYRISTKKTGAGKGFWGNLSHKNYFLKVLQELHLIKNKHIPLIYKCNSKAVRLLLLAGILDSDGHYQEHCRQFEVTFKSKILADDLVYLSRSLGFAAYSKPCRKKWTSPNLNNKYKGEGSYFRVIISGDGLEEIPTKLMRKKALKRNQKKDVLVTGINVEKLGPGEFFGFELDGNGRFLLGDFTVTHNTLLIRKICEYYGLEHFDIKSALAQDGSLNMDRATESTVDTHLFPDEDRPKVCVLEDIDKFTAFQGGDAAEKDYAAVSLHSLLKGLDGVDQYDGVILIATSNFPDVLHEALVGRPGRFDKIYEIERPLPEAILRFLNYYKISVKGDGLDKVVQQLKGSSMAFVSEFVKSAKMKYKRNEITPEEVKVLIDAIKQHQKLCEQHFKEEKKVGFSNDRILSAQK